MVWVMANENQSLEIEGWIRRLEGGDAQAREQLLNLASERLTRLARKMLKGFPRVKRWEETDDVLQNTLLRLHRSLAEVRPASTVEFYRLAAVSIRRELLDLAKHYYGPQGLGANYASIERRPEASTSSPGLAPPAEDEDTARLEGWANFHQQVERLPNEEREVFDLLWYQQLSQAETSRLLDVSERTVKRRWAAARLRLHEALGGKSPQS
jgi:RNA polymerase sigma-70 factor (ECF subfamily)